MSEVLGERLPTRATLLELQAERAVMEEGYAFLDEKRLLLAAQLLQRLQALEQAQAEFARAQGRARAALRAGLLRHALEGLQSHPAAELAGLHLRRRSTNLLGVPLQDLQWRVEAAAVSVQAEHPSPEAATVAGRFRELLGPALALAAASGDLRRLLAEYRRTEGRARALEDVLIPETVTAIRELEDRLDDLDREEAVRVRHHALRRGGPGARLEPPENR